MLATTPDITDRPDAIEAPALRGEVRYAGVGFGYDPGRPVLRGIDLVVQPGEVSGHLPVTSENL